MRHRRPAAPWLVQTLIEHDLVDDCFFSGCCLTRLCWESGQATLRDTSDGKPLRWSDSEGGRRRVAILIYKPGE